MSVESKLNAFTVDLKEMPVNMRLFSLSLRSLYSENALGVSSETAIRMNSIRDEIRKDALVYVKGALPLSTQVVRSIKELFEYYHELDIEEWEENLPDILNEVKGFKQCCIEVIRMHEGIMVPLKTKESEAKLLISELKDLTKEYLRRKQILENSASSKRGWAVALFFVPGINVVATPLLSFSAASDLAGAVAKRQQSKINQSVIFVVSETMIPAISAFINGLNAAVGFFNVVEQELTTFQNKGERALTQEKRLHYHMMKKKAIEVKQSCNAFYAMIPGVRTDFKCIPEMMDDRNYVDKWLIKQHDEIKKKYASRITGPLRKMLCYFTTIQPDQPMTE